MFEEISSGVYRVVKDRFEMYLDYVSYSAVVDVLNNIEKVSVAGNI